MATVVAGLVHASTADASLAKAADVAKYSFGTPTSVTRHGFTKVTIGDTFSPEKGFGFQSTLGLLAYDRGGAQIVPPQDDYTARTYGAYRLTSDLTCSFVEGTTDNAFVVALPDDEYTVWLIASDAEWDPPLFEVWANGQKKVDVRIPRARFVLMEPFQARAMSGRLQIEFKGPHGWLLNGLVIGKAGLELDNTMARLERDIFFLTGPEQPNWQELKTEPTNPPLEWTAAEQQRGYLVFPVDYTEAITPAFVPARTAVGKPLTAVAAPGEFEPVSFCVTARQDLGEATLELSDFVADETQRTIARENVEVGIVRCWPQRAIDHGGRGEYQIVPEMIEAPLGRVTRVPGGQVRQWWLTVHVPEDAQAGRYRMLMTLRPEKASPTVLEWRLLVLPFKLTRPADKHWGTWLESFPPVGGLRGPERRGRNTRAEEARLVRADLADYRDHGFDLAIFNYYFGVKEKPEGGFVYDISKLARDLDYWKTLGTDTPVAIGCEYTFRNLEYGLAEPGRAHVPGTFSPKARQAIVGLVQHIRDEAQRHGWPELYFYPIDEPGNNKTENRMRFAEAVLDLVHEVPGCRTATTVGASEVQRLGDRVDVRIYAFGSYSRKQVLEESRQGHPFWFYENGMFYGHSTLASRGLTGFEFLRSGAEVATAWGFDCTTANPYNDFDGGHRDWNVILPGVDAPMPTIYWELCREGVDDCRYVATLQQQIRLARERGEVQAARRGEQVLEPLLNADAQPISEPLAFSRCRWRIAREILNLTGHREPALSFPAVVSNPASAEKLGPNEIPDPSFEAGPQADGFPVPTYQIADAYATPEKRPVGALAVTDEVARSGRYSLKWDFGKATGKGSVYDGKRYLIVNVQVPQDTARALRGKRVTVGYWFRLGGGAAVPGMTLRQSGKQEYLDVLSHRGGVDDPAMWNRFQAEGRLRNDFENLDIHISCPVPDDDALAAQSVFYIDDVSLHAIEEPPLVVSTALDEYYIGEPVSWTIRTAPTAGQVRITLLAGDKVVAEQEGRIEGGMLRGVFDSGGLKAGSYLLRATGESPPANGPATEREFLLTPDPFDWPPRQL